MKDLEIFLLDLLEFYTRFLVFKSCPPSESVFRVNPQKLI